MTGSIGDLSLAGEQAGEDEVFEVRVLPRPPAGVAGVDRVGAVAGAPPLPPPARPVAPSSDRGAKGSLLPRHGDAATRRRLVVRTPRATPSDRAQKAARLSTLDRDAGTGLVPRSVLLAELERVLNRGRPAVLLSVGLDLGGMAGQNIGDEELTAAVAHRVSTAVRSGDPVASFGADGLFVLIEDVAHQELAMAIARRLVAAASGPVSLRGRMVEASAGVGVVLTHEADAASSGDIVRAAAHGRHQARALGGDRVEIASPVPARDAARRARQWPRRELERAVQNAEFLAHYQPVVAVGNADLVGFEALVRWEHPQLGLLTPPAFVDAAESTGILVRIGTEIMRQSLRQLGRWIDRLGDRPLTMAINFSTRQLAAPDMVDTVIDLVRASGIPHRQVVLEIGEASLTSDDAEMAGTLIRLRDEGIQLSLDDFGSGSASFAALGRVPFDVVKLDRKIVSDMSAPTGAAVAHAMVQLGHSLGKQVVAEGVETPRELAMLRQMECDLAQGHLFSRPKPAGVIDSLLERWVTPTG